ncbi:MAG: DHH family phosphoesterase [Nanoarchaeota archaeon]
MTIYIFGHKNPDTDSVVSAIVYANFLNWQKIDAEAVCLGELNKETKFILDKLDINYPRIVKQLEKNSKVILVDHNEKTQSIENLGELKIEEIIDHHKFNFNVSYPINIRAEKLGSTCSIVFKILKEANYNINKDEGILLISGIISDTLFFRSPTSTEIDKKIVEKLNEIAEIEDLEKYSLEMFEEKSNVDHLDIKDLVKLDYKEYEFKGKKYGVGVIETTSPKNGFCYRYT